MSEQYPVWTCRDCALKNGGRIVAGVSSMWEGECPVCGEKKWLTEPRDYGYPKFWVGKEKPHEKR
nr:hypothetical protein 23 [bacterium]